MALRPKTPWFLALQLALEAGRNLKAIPEAERRRAVELLRKSQGRPSNLSQRERDELKAVARALDLPGVARSALPFGGGRKKRGLFR
jgi:hypothetical protein